MSEGTPEHREDLECLVIRVLEQEKNRARKTKKPPKSGARSSFTLLSLLEDLEKQLVHFEPMLNFDLMLFSCDCALMLSTLDNKFRPGSQRLPEDFVRTPPDFVDGLLWSVADTVHIAQPRNPAELKRVVQGTNFGGVIHTLNGVIKSSGNKYARPAFEKSSGYIPKSMWPEI